jgi:hypothetical protein
MQPTVLFPPAIFKEKNRGAMTIGLGAGLMAFVFYSSRHDMDR